MEKIKIRELLGMKQEEIALLLEITRSQWAMYETGKRDLPTAAKLKLAEMLAFVQKKDSYWKKELPIHKEQTLQKKKKLEDLIVINKHHQFITELKLKDIKKKYNVNFNRLKTMRYFEMNPQKLSKKENLLLEVMSNRAKNEIEKKGLLKQLEIEVKLETLQEEEKVLKKKLNDLG
ncbi:MULTISPECIES: helix-turn-helix domain-containing protein [Flavobacterium]|jgi:transcriptional regulator with XRE-family HTH domain|uniref:Helix-turn-helix domain-containing protein n=1 Tax=Flavobacterium jumunjinense TaxID=998845 RepID=A0ABV5GQN1_9FLAO|nr:MULTISPECIES: helix-turn-helix transcriptional regulator [Flavobacterium]